MSQFLDAAIDYSQGGGRDAPSLYLAQQSLREGQLQALMEDIHVPDVLRGKQMAQINLWMTVKASRCAAQSASDARAKVASHTP
jgi:hypothetical protein